MVTKKDKKKLGLLFAILGALIVSTPGTIAETAITYQSVGIFLILLGLVWVFSDD